MKVYIVEYNPRDGDPNGWYLRMTDTQAKELRRIFHALQVEDVFTDEWRIDAVDELAMSYKNFGEVLQDLQAHRKKGPKDWFPGAR